MAVPMVTLGVFMTFIASAFALFVIFLADVGLIGLTIAMIPVSIISFLVVQAAAAPITAGLVVSVIALAYLLHKKNQ